MKEILFLCHRIPYPPNKGDKIRSFNWLRALATKYKVHLGSFVDDPNDWVHREQLAKWCDELCLRPLAPRRSKLRSLSGLINKEALSLAYYRDRKLQAWVDTVMRERRIDCIFVFCSTMAPYVIKHDEARRILDFVDVDSDKWTQYADHGRGPMRWVYKREARLLADAECQLARVFDASVFVSMMEAEFFRRMAPDCATRVHGIANGVDIDYFDRARYDSEPGEAGARIVFTGAMDYGANVDAVCWFVNLVWPRVKTTKPEARFIIVGMRPTRRVLALANNEGIEVTGAVPDVRPYLTDARLAIAPMRIARGLQNKVLEALAMGCPVVVSPQAQAGLEPGFDVACDTADTPEAFADAVIRRLAEPPNDTIRQVARDYVAEHYAWSARFAELDHLLAIPDETPVAELVE